MTSRANGKAGEQAAEQLLVYEGWEIIERQAPVHGHTLDLRAKHPAHGEALFEVKVWATASGTDNAKKAIADAYDLRAAGETTPYILILSKDLTGLLGDMLRRAIREGVIADVRILGFLPFDRWDDE